MQKRYYEFYVKVIIEEIFNINLEVMDKPDLQSEVKNIGIEFTSAEDSDNKEIQNLGIILAENRARNKENVIKKINRKGGKYTRGVILGKVDSFEDSKKRIYKAIENKLEKLNLKSLKKMIYVFFYYAQYQARRTERFFRKNTRDTIKVSK